MIEQQQAGRNAEQYLFEDEQAILVRTVLVEMPERQQVCLMLRSIGSSYEEIAELTYSHNSDRLDTGTSHGDISEHIQ